MMDQIGHYRIVSELGRGGMGVVYKAHEESLNRYVAIKVLGEHLSEDQSYVQRFVREAQSAAKLNHPNIVQIYAISEDAGRHYFVMEYVSGTSILRLLREHGKMTPTQASRIVLQSAAGLQAAHDEGVIHRDVKPANLLITDRGLVKIADFGLALLAGGASRLTATGMFMGTPGYLSPEQCLDEDVDHRTDIYSLGVTFFEMLTGSMPFTATSPMALLRQIIEVEPPDVQELNPEVDEGARSVLARIMAKQRDERYPSCAELITDLQRYLEGQGTSAQEVESVTAGTAAACAAPAPPPPPPPGGGDAPTLAVEQNAAATEPAAAADPRSTATPPAIVAEAVPRPSRGRAVGLVVAAAVLLALVTAAGAGVVAWRTGLLQRAWSVVRGQGGSETPGDTPEGQVTDRQLMADVGGVEERETSTETPAGTTAAVPSAEGADGSQPTSTGDTEGDSHATSGDTSSSAPAQVEAAPQPGTEHRPSAGPTGQVPPPRQEPSRPARESTATGRPEPPPPPPPGVAVVGIGEPLLAGEASRLIERALAKAGRVLVDENGYPDVMDLLGNGAEALPGDVARALRPYARALVLVRAEYLGYRDIYYMGRPDRVFESRLFVTPIDLVHGEPLGPGFEEKLEYTQVSVEREVEKVLRPRIRRFLASLGQR